MLERGYSCVLALPTRSPPNACFSFCADVPTQLGMLIDSAQVSAKEGAGKGLTEQSRLGPVGGLWASCAVPDVPHSLILGFYKVTEGVRYLVPMCPGPSEPKNSLGLHVSPSR